MMTDPIADMLTRIRNAATVHKTEVLMPYSNLKFAIAQILAREGYAASAERMRAKYGVFDELKITLKYQPDRRSVIRSLRRVSSPGRRWYAKYQDFRKTAGGQGIMIISTPKGVMTDKEARKLKVGGEVLCEVY